MIGLIAAWLIALFLPVADVRTGAAMDVTFGSDILMLGWMGPMVLILSWFANITFAAICWLLWRDAPPRRGWAIGLGLATLLLGLEALAWQHMSGLTPHVVENYRAGFWLWLVIMMTAGLLAIVTVRPARET